MRLQAFAVLAPVESGDSEVSEAAVTAAPARIAGCPGPAENWYWLTSATEMAAQVSGVWPIAWSLSAQRWPGYPKVATRTPGAGAGSVRAARRSEEHTSELQSQFHL